MRLPIESAYATIGRQQQPWFYLVPYQRFSVKNIDPTPIPPEFWGVHLGLHCVSKNRTLVTFSNNSNNPGSISTSFGTENRQLIGT